MKPRLTPETMYQAPDMLRMLQHEIAALIYAINEQGNHHQALSLEEHMPTLIHQTKEFQPSNFSDQAECNVKCWAKKLGIWDELRGDNANSMNGYLHASAENEAALTLTGKVYCVLYVGDDRFGNERMATYSPEEVKRVSVIIQNIAVFLQKVLSLPLTLESALNTFENFDLLPPKEQGFVQAIIEVTLELKATAPAEWFEYFVSDLQLHIYHGMKDYSTLWNKKLVNLEEYVLALRNYASGMNISYLLSQYATGVFFLKEDVEKCKEHGILDVIMELIIHSQQIGALGNDVISYEKEYHESLLDPNKPFDFNLVPLLWLHNKNFTFVKAFEAGARYVDSLMIHFLRFRESLDEKLVEVNVTDPEFARKMWLFLYKTLSDLPYATGKWQFVTDRYRRQNSIIKELRLP